MRIKDCKLVFLVVLLGMLIASKTWADSAQSREYQIKAAFIYNFIKFVDWPKEKVSDSNQPITIGIIGRDPFGNAFEPIMNKKAKGRSIVIKRFKSFKELKKSAEKDKPELDRKIETLTKCHLLFICSSEKKNLKEIINTVKNHDVLTVGETRGFLEAGGIINCFVEQKKVRFEINITAAKCAKLKIRSKLLRLAKRVVTEDDVKDGSRMLETNYVYYAKL